MLLWRDLIADAMLTRSHVQHEHVFCDFTPHRERITESVKNALDENSIGIPFPQMDVHVNGKFLAKTATAAAES